MSEQLALPFCDASVSSAEASPAKTSPLQEKALDSQANAQASGGNTPASFAIWDPQLSWWKTCPAFGPGVSTLFSGRLPRSGTMRNGILSVLPTLAPITAANASSSSRGLWPTPTSGDAKASGAAGYPTVSGRHSGTTLTDATVRGWLTPRAHDGRGGAGRAATTEGGPDLRTTAVGRLNPAWVESLMGFPPGWTDGPPVQAKRSTNGKRRARSNRR